jgi:hypothetical protein
MKYHGSAGRPLDSLEQLFINTPLAYSPYWSPPPQSPQSLPPQKGEKVELVQNTAAYKIQNCVAWRSTQTLLK